MSNPLVSILICCHNRGHLIAETIDSVLAQSYTPVEIIVLDDGSTDNTKEVIAGFGDKVRYVHQPNQGIASARTNACKLAHGDLIAFQDDDDLMPPHRVSLLQAALADNPECVFAVGDMAYMDDNGQLTGKRWLPEGRLSAADALVIANAYEAVIWPSVPATPHTTLFWRKFGDRIGWFKQRYKFASEDKDFFARLGRLGPIVYIPEIVSLYRRGHQSLTANVLRTEYGQLRFLVDHFNDYGKTSKALPDRLQTRICRGLCTIRRLEIATGTRFGDPQERRALLSEARSKLGLAKKTRYWWETIGKSPLRRIAHLSST